MTTRIQLRRGTKTQHNSFTGANGEVTVNTTDNSLHVHDGTTQGGFPAAKSDLANVSGAINLSLSGITTTGSLSIGSTQVISSGRQLQNIVSLDATTTATIESAIASGPNDFTSLNVSGVSTFSGITTHTASLFGTQASFSGVVTATSGFVGSLTGLASSATQLATGRTVAITGDIAYTSGSFDGTGNVTGTGTLATVNGNIGTFGSQTLIPVVTVNAKGLVTAVTTAAVGTALTVSGDSGSVNIDLLSETLTISGGTNLTSVGSGNTVTVNLDDNISLTSIVVGSGVTINASGINAAAGIITATTFVGAFTGTATSTSNIPNLTGAITSNNTTTSLGSFSSANLATALTDETGTGAAVFATSPTLTTPVLGTPSSGTLTSCTGLPISGLTSSTSIALGVGSIELGHASDTTIARVSAGVVSIEGVNIVTTSATQTLTNKTLTSPTLTTPALGAATATSVNASGIITANSYDIGTAAGISTTITGITTTDATAIDSFSTSTYRSSKMQIQITQGTDYQASDVLVIHNGTTANIIEYGSIATNDYLGTFSSSVSGGNCLLSINMISATSATVKVLSQRITI